MQLIDREKGHHADLIRHYNEECCVSRCLNELSLRVDLFPIDVEQVQTINDVSDHAEKGRCDGHKRDRGTEEDADCENGQRLRVEVPIEEVVLLVPEPRLKILVDLSSHIGEPGGKVTKGQIRKLEHVVSGSEDASLQDKGYKKHAIFSHVEFT